MAGLANAGQIIDLASNALSASCHTVSVVHSFLRNKYRVVVTHPEIIRKLLDHIDTHAQVNSVHLHIEDGKRTWLPHYGRYTLRTRDIPIHIRYREGQMIVSVVEHQLFQLVAGHGGSNRWMEIQWYMILSQFRQPQIDGKHPVTVPSATSRYRKYLTNFLSQFRTAQEELASQPEAETHGLVAARIMYYIPIEGQWTFSAEEIVNYDNDRLSAEAKLVLADIDEFITTGAQPGRKFARKYLVHGASGTGKTALTRVAATRHNLPIYSLHISSTDITSQNIRELMADAGRQAKEDGKASFIILLDEVDKFVANLRERRVAARVSAHDLLTSLDGAIPLQDGAIVIMTANDISFLRTAPMDLLNREGRIDRIIEFTTALTTAPVVLSVNPAAAAVPAAGLVPEPEFVPEPESVLMSPSSPVLGSAHNPPAQPPDVFPRASLNGYFVHLAKQIRYQESYIADIRARGQEPPHILLTALAQNKRELAEQNLW